MITELLKKETSARWYVAGQLVTSYTSTITFQQQQKMFVCFFSDFVFSKLIN